MPTPTKTQLQEELFDIKVALDHAEQSPLEKKWWKSKMVWINVAQFLSGVALLVADLPEEMDTAAIALLVNGVLQTALRIWGTSTKLTK